MTATLAAGRRLGAVERLFAGRSGAGLPAVGVELELLPVGLSCPSRPVPVGDLRRLLAGVPFVSYEPGGQVELSPPPQPSVAGACEHVARLTGVVRRRLAPAGIAVLGCGVHPWLRDVGLQLPTARYVAMDRHFAAIGPAGRSFMRRTASTQVCVDLAAGDRGRAQWRAANLAAPVLAAVFANASLDGGHRLGHNGGRTALTMAADPARMGHGRFPDSDDPVADYSAFAACAAPISEAYAGAVDAHLSTLFPPVRPRGAYLEVRAVDSLPMAEVRTALVLTTVLLADERATEAVGSLDAGESGRRWAVAAGAGLRDAGLRAEATALVGLAVAAARRLPAGYLPADAGRLLARLHGRVEAGVAPGDLLDL